MYVYYARNMVKSLVISTIAIAILLVPAVGPITAHNKANALLYSAGFNPWIYRR
jgi:hypothetical protein